MNIIKKIKDWHYSRTWWKKHYKIVKHNDFPFCCRNCDAGEETAPICCSDMNGRPCPCKDSYHQLRLKRIPFHL